MYCCCATYGQVPMHNMCNPDCDCKFNRKHHVLFLGKKGRVQMKWTCCINCIFYFLISLQHILQGELIIFKKELRWVLIIYRGSQSVTRWSLCHITFAPVWREYFCFGFFTSHTIHLYTYWEKRR